MPTPTATEVRPSVEDVAILERTRTAGGAGLGSDDGVDGTFTDTTRPTASDVEHFIDTAIDLIVPQIGTAYEPTKHAEQVKRLVALQAAILIEGSVFRERVDEGAVALWSSIIARIMPSLIAVTGGVVPDEGGGTPEPTPPKVFGSFRMGTTVSTAPVPPVLDNLA